MRNFRRFQMACVWLGFTGAHVAWAQPAQPDFYVEDPYAPHNTNGNTARLGTTVGFIYGQPTDVLALGVTAAVGHRFGRLAIESEASLFELETRGTIMTPLGLGDGNITIGNAERLGVIARYDVIRLDSNVVGPNSMLAIYVEGGAATAWNHWSKPGPGEDSRIVPDDTQRVEGQAGFGLTLDHRLQEPIGFPRRISWSLGWRIAMSPRDEVTGSICRGVSCRPVPMAEDQSSLVDRSMMFQSNLAFTF